MDRNLFIKYSRLAAEAQVKRGTKESVYWFTRRIRKDSPVKIDDVVKPLNRGRITPGKMFAYTYNPKLKDKLSYYDNNPLVIVLELTTDGWYGANLHYLPPKLRAELMEAVLTKKHSPIQIVKSLEASPLTKPCLKRYLVGQLVTRPKEIPQDEWEIAIQLPFESFEKAAMKEVWAASKRKK